MSYIDQITTVFVHFRMLSEEARLIDDIKYISDNEVPTHIHFCVYMFRPWLFFKGK